MEISRGQIKYWGVTSTKRTLIIVFLHKDKERKNKISKNDKKRDENETYAAVMQSKDQSGY